MSNSSRRPAPRQVPPPSSTAGASLHTRFIPREELAGYTSWSPGALGPEGQVPSAAALQAPIRDAGLQRQAGGRPPDGAAAGERASSVPTAAPESVSGQDMEELQQLARQAGYHDGYRDGLAALENFKRSFAQQMAAQVGQLLSAVDREFRGLEADMAKALVSASTGLARQIVRSELATRPEFVTQVARQAVAALSQSVQRIELRVHPDDLALVQGGLGEECEARGVRCLPDPAISRGGCTLETELGSVDARIEHQWELALHRAGLDAGQWPLQTRDEF